MNTDRDLVLLSVSGDQLALGHVIGRFLCAHARVDGV